MRTSHINALRALEATLRKGSFTAAGDELGVTAAAVGQHVRHLEDYLGRTLFERRPTGAVPTALALSVRERLHGSFRTLSEVLDDLGRRRPDDRLAVTLPESFAENWFVPRLAAFYRDNRGVDLRLDSTNRRVDLLVEDLDYGIRYSPPPDASLTAVDLFGDWVLPVCTPAVARAHGLGPACRSLAGVPLLHLENRTPDPGWSDWPTWARAFCFPPDEAHAGPRLSRFGSGIQVALAGQGLIMAGLTEAWSALSDGRLIAPFGPARRLPTAYRYRLVSVAARSRSPLHRRFEQWITAEAKAFRAAVQDRFGDATPPESRGI